MFKEENRIWWYILGAFVMIIALALFSRDYLIPVFLGQRPILEEDAFVFASPPAQSIDTSKDYQARLYTSKGEMLVDLYESAAPRNVNNIVFLANQGYYNGTKFHRLFPGLLVQGGDRNTLDTDVLNDGRGGPGYFTDDEINWDSLDFSDAKRQTLTSRGYTSEAGLESKHLQKFSMAMANTLPDTNGSQFFFVIADDADARIQEMDGQYTVVGRLINGGDTLSAINAVPVNDVNADNPRPTEDITINHFEIIIL